MRRAEGGAAGSPDPGRAVASSMSPSTRSYSPGTHAGSLLWARPVMALRQELASHIHQSWGGVTCPLHPQGWPESWGMSGSLCSARSPAILPDIPRAWCGVSPTFPLSWLETPAFHPLPLIPTQHHLLNKEVGTLFPGSGYPGTFLLPPLGQDKGLLQNLGEEQPRASPNPRL